MRTVLVVWFGCCLLAVQAFVSTPRPLAQTTNSLSSPKPPLLFPLESVTTTTTESTTTRTLNDDDALLNYVRSSLSEVMRASDRLKSVLCTFIASTWWLTPLVLCLVPLYTLCLFQCLPVTPDCWKLVQLQPFGHSVSSIGGFLLSNVVYFVSGGYLCYKSDTTRSLGLWTLLAGLVSTIFHSVQVVDYRLAEALCYFDHGVAITSILYFVKTLGLPGLRTTVLSALGLVLLANPLPDLYLWLHSFWHVCSAGAALTWAMDAARLQRTIVKEDAFDFLRNH